ncbi:MAG: cation transporter [Nocardioidaceae bacterium]
MAAAPNDVLRIVIPFPRGVWWSSHTPAATEVIARFSAWCLARAANLAERMYTSGWLPPEIGMELGFSPDAVRRALLISLPVTAALQPIVVVLSGSVALLGDTLHNLADAVTAMPLLIAFRLARRSPTKRYSHGFRAGRRPRRAVRRRNDHPVVGAGRLRSDRPAPPPARRRGKPTSPTTPKPSYSTRSDDSPPPRSTPAPPARTNPPPDLTVQEQRFSSPALHP